MRWTFRQISSLLFFIGVWTIFTFYSTYTLTPNVHTGALVDARSTDSVNKFKKQSQYEVVNEESYYKNNVTGKKQDIIVIMWDSGTPFSWGDGQIVNTPNYGGYVIDKGECPVNCIFTTERKYLHSADALLFDTCLTGPTEYREVPIYFPEKREGQHWLWFAYEQQYYFPMMQEETYMSKFDYKMTYHQDSLVHISFTCPWGGLNTFLDPPPPKNKKKLAVLMASNCNTGGATERTEYVKELMKYMDIDSVGGCLHNTDLNQPHTKRSHGDKIREKVKIISEYKFLLAFENNNHVPDYVTEKMTNAYQAGSVPVYWGAPNVDDWVIGDHSIIKTTDYASPKELAEYLNYLNDHDEEYYKYFDWKKKGISPSYQQLLDDCLFYAECRLCKKLATMKNPNVVEKDKLVIKDIDDAWAIRLNCIECREERWDQFVYIPHKPILSLTNEFTLSAWIKLDQIQDGRIIDKGTAGNLNGYSFDVVKTSGGPIGRLRFCGGGGCFASQRTLHVGVWYFVTATFEHKENGLVFYINGKKDSTHSPSKECDTNELALKFGRASEGGGSWRPYHQSSIFDGYLDDVSIWNRVLTEYEIEDMMFRRLSGKEQDLVGYWGFNEGTGNLAMDSSPNMLHGVLYGDPLWVPSLSKPLTDPSNIER